MDPMEDAGSNMEMISGSKKKKGKKVSQKVRCWIGCHSASFGGIFVARLRGMFAELWIRCFCNGVRNLVSFLLRRSKSSRRN